jgi:cephalosporin hydroxylase
VGTVDDRSAFEEEKQRSIEAMARDKTLADANINLILASDKHRYSYVWSWMGVPIIQRPADVMALQEILWETKPDVVLEAGVARGGSVVFFASMLRICGVADPTVIGIDVEIRAHNRQTIERHPMAPHIRLIEGSSIAAETVSAARAHIPPGAKVMVVLDSNHSYDHVTAELEAYAPLVSPGMFLVVADTLLGLFSREQAPTYYSNVLLPGNEPLAAVNNFLKNAPNFAKDVLNGKLIMSSSPDGFLRRVT